jgi:hypothetical protein
MKHSLLIRFSIAAAFLAGMSDLLPAHDQPSIAQLARKFARHFDDRPPVMFEVEANGDHAGRILVTNLHQYPLTRNCSILRNTRQDFPAAKIARSETVLHAPELLLIIP